MSNFPLEIKDLPPPTPLRKMVGPSFILLGLGLGSGELILWPYLVSNFGMGLAWGILIGVTIQFFINMEVERYALVFGESVFVGFVRKARFLPLWFIASTFLGFGWPGIGLSASHLLSSALQINIHLVNVVIFIIIGAILTFGKVLYQTVETLQKYLILIGVPLILLLTIYVSSTTDWMALFSGLIGRGNGYFLFPAGISLATFLGALAYSGAGGNLNLAQSFYIRDKGYGMGAYAQRITSLFRNSQSIEEIKLTGTTFPLTPENISRFKIWWKRVNIEHLIVFWALGLITMLTLSLLAYSTTFGHSGNVSGINFVLNEALAIGSRTIPIIGVGFVIVAGLMLVATQLTVLDSTSRIITENLLLLRGNRSAQLSKTFYIVLWVQIIFGVIVSAFNIDQPRQLLTMGAVINAFSMFFYIGLLLWLNNTAMAKALRPSWAINIFLAMGMVFFGVLGFLVFSS
jgi:hypothetical protein